MYIQEPTLDHLLLEDMPYGDLSTALLGIGEMPAKAKIVSRQNCVVSGTEEVIRIIKKLGGTVSSAAQEGSAISAGEIILAVTGTAGMLHAAWKVSINILEYCSGVASRTRHLLDLAKSVNKNVALVTTRKTIPGTRDLAIKASCAGGAFPHRLGLSETILFFEQHCNFTDGLRNLLQSTPRIRAACPERKMIVEVTDYESALLALDAGVDGIQCDKMPVKEIEQIVKIASQHSPIIIVIATGGINDTNIVSYAETGVHVIATSSVYYGAPADFGFELEKA